MKRKISNRNSRMTIGERLARNTARKPDSSSNMSHWKAVNSCPAVTSDR
jgi:hypothetical protein